jgi:hypothetical protein
LNGFDRIVNVASFAGAAALWAGLGYVLTTYYPTQSAAALLAGALLLGGAVAFTFAPLFWLGAFVRANRIAYRGSWWRAGRRAALFGLVVTLVVLMRGQDVFSVPLALFIVAMAVLVELTLSLRG